MRPTARLTKPALGFFAGALALVFLFGGIAKAHVTVDPPEAEQGGFTKLTFSVPNELPDASTVTFRVQLPPDHPFTSVSVKPKAGWTFTTTEAPLPTPVTNDDGETITTSVSEITWTGGEINAGEFDEFEISVGPLPENAEQLFFPAIQTYSNGDEVAWIDKPDASGEEPEHPAPELTLVAASAAGDSHDSGAAVTATTTSSSSSSEQAASTSNDSDDTAKGLAIVAIVVGGLAIVLAIVAIATRPKKPTSST